LFDVITIGSATIDVFAYTEYSEMFSMRDSHAKKEFIAYPIGEKILIDRLEFHTGGGGTNTAASFSRLGLNTAFLGKIGNDENGNQIINYLKSENISFIGARGGKSGYSVVLDSLEKDRTILTFKGANDFFTQSDVVLANLQTKWLYSSSMIGQSFETLISVIDVVKRTGAKIAFNPSNYQAKLGLKKLGSILKKVDVLILNKEEAQLLIGYEEVDTKKLVMMFSELGPSYIAITDGSRGVVCLNNKKIISIGASSNVKVVEATGAGDAFASAFVAGLIYNLSIVDALKLGMCQAESVLSMPGAKNYLMKKEEGFERIKTFDGKVIVEDVKGDLFLPKFHIADVGKEFVLTNGTKISELKDLANLLKTIPDEIFHFHTRNNTNDFSNWIKHVFGLEKLADDLLKQNTKEKMSQTIIDFLKNES
jgi:ribokinase